MDSHPVVFSGHWEQGCAVRKLWGLEEGAEDIIHSRCFTSHSAAYRIVPEFLNCSLTLNPCSVTHTLDFPVLPISSPSKLFVSKFPSSHNLNPSHPWFPLPLVPFSLWPWLVLSISILLPHCLSFALTLTVYSLHSAIYEGNKRPSSLFFPLSTSRSTQFRRQSSLTISLRNPSGLKEFWSWKMARVRVCSEEHLVCGVFIYFYFF